MSTQSDINDQQQTIDRLSERVESLERDANSARQELAQAIQRKGELQIRLAEEVRQDNQTS